MAKNVGKFDWLLPSILEVKKNGTYMVVSGDKFYPLKIPEYGIEGRANSGNNGEEIIDLTEDMIVYDSSKEFPNLVDLEDAVEKAKLEACRKEVERYVNELETGVRKPGEWSLGKRIDKLKPSPYNWGEKDDTIKDIPHGKTREFFLGKPVLPDEQITKGNRSYTTRDLERISYVFKGCEDIVVAGQLMRVKDMKPKEAKLILRFLGARFSIEDLEAISSGIQENQRGMIESLSALETDKYKSYLEGLKNSQV